MAKSCMAVPRGCHPQNANISLSGDCKLLVCKDYSSYEKNMPLGLANQYHELNPLVASDNWR